MRSTFLNPFYFRLSALLSVRLVRPAFLVVAALTLALSAGSEGARAEGTLYVETTPMPQGRQMHGAAVLGDNLYVFGGALPSTGWTDSVARAPIQPGGRLGDWSETTPLPAKRHYIATSTIVLNDVVYIAGGQTGDTNSTVVNTVAWTRPLGNGDLEPWRESPPFTQQGLSFIPVVSTPGYIHLIGGLQGDSNPSSMVISGSISADGNIAAWEEGIPLPQPLWWHHAAAVGGRVWVWSGLPTSEYTTISTTIYSTPIQSTGRLGAWREERRPFPVPLFGAITATAGSYALAFCPRLSLDESDNVVWFTQVGPQGMGNWNKLPTSLPNAIYFATACDYRRGTVYVVGGKEKRGTALPLDPRVLFFHLAASAQETPAAGTAGSAAASAGAMASTGASMGAPGTGTAASGVSPGVASGMANPAAAPGARTGLAQFSYQAQVQVGSGTVAGFMTYDQARRAAAGPPARPLVIYFHSGSTRACQDQVAALAGSQFASLTQQAAFAWVDVGESPQITQQMGVYKVPTWSLFDTRGNPAGQVSSLLTVEQLSQGVAAAAR